VDDILATLETEKTTVDIRAENDGQVTKYFGEESAELEVSTDFVEIDTSVKAPTESEAPKKDIPKSEAPKKEEPQKDIQKSVETKVEKSETTKQPESTQSSQSTPNVGFSRSEKVVPMNKMRQTIAKRLKQSQNEYATLTTFNECDMGNAMDLRTKYQDQFVKKHGIKLGLMGFFLKASTIALQENPAVNSVIQENNIINRNYIDISVAVASPTGLLVPVIRNCSSLGFADFELTLADLGKKAKDGKITIEDMQGGTFTISNGGVYGSLFGTPIINPPQTAILGMHNIVNRPVVRNGQIVARPIMYLALSYDHRLIDGREAVLFLRRIKELVEEPEKLLLDI
jgi:2-oxoglutarate dehydrogenase E2 component (dihydrolipoamide succinyltransferase)